MTPPFDNEGPSRRLVELEHALRAARDVGADVSKAEVLRQEAKSLLWNGQSDAAMERIESAMDLVEYAHRHRVGNLLSEARRVIAQMEEDGVPAEEAWHHLSMADEAFEAFEIDLALFEANVAVQRMGGASRLRMEAIEALDWTRWLSENLARYGTVLKEDAESLRVQGNLLTQGEFELSISIGGELEPRLERHLERHIPVLLERCRSLIRDLRSDLPRDEVRRAKEAFDKARRHCKRGDVHTCLGMIRSLESIHEGTLGQRANARSLAEPRP